MVNCNASNECMLPVIAQLKASARDDLPGLVTLDPQVGRLGVDAAKCEIHVAKKICDYINIVS